MINRTKLEHILEYARQQRRFGQHCKIPPGDMVEIVEIAMRKTGNYPVTPDGWISCSERTPESIPGSCKEYLVFDALNNKVHHDYWVVPDGDSAPVASFWNHYGAHVTHWMSLPEPPQEVNRG